MNFKREDMRNGVLIASAAMVGIAATVFVLARTHGAQKRDDADVAGERADKAWRGTALLARAGFDGAPLIYVDGVRINPIGDGDAEAAFEDLGLSPRDIERIEVLKGPGTKEGYGSEASNGVVFIHTKSGDRDNTRDP